MAAELDRGRRRIGEWRSPWIQVCPVAPSPLLALLRTRLHGGEAEAIGLTIERGARLVIDEEEGRQVALDLGLRITGSAGLVLLARQRGLIPRVAPLLDDLRARGGLWLSDLLYAQVLASAGEG